ncbi:MAG: CZB domain-containing protein [Thiobacillus sp.]|nr:CZB domain-containing protein [Thiobacillus sp.]
MKILDWFKRAATTEAPADVSTIQTLPAENATVEGLDFQAAVAAHQKWKTRLRNCIDGTSEETLDPRVVCQDNQCVLGKWINGPGGARFATSPGFAKLKSTHAEFHICASEVLVSVYSGKKSLAEERLADEFSRLSIRVQKNLSQLFLEVSNENKI